MIILQASGLNKYLGGRQVLNNIDFTLQNGEKVGLVGINGSGKSTFLKCLAGVMWFESGNVFKYPHSNIGYLEQVNIENDEVTAWDFVMETFSHVLQLRVDLGVLEERMKAAEKGIERILSRYSRLQEEYEKAGGYSCENTTRRVLSGLGFLADDFNKPVGSFSGGQKTRLKLARLLAGKPDCLLLDEPTNHLDIASVEWLEQYLTDFAGALLLVSHDRMLLDRVPNRIAELDNGMLYSYSGNYSEFLKKRAERNLAWERAYQRQQEEIRKTEEFINRSKAGVKARQARGRELQLKRIDRIDKPPSRKTSPGWTLTEAPRSGEDIVRVINLEKSFADTQLFNRLSFQVRRGDKVALVGPNGCGKSTLLKILQGKESADHGEIQWGSRIRVGYFAQENEDLNPANTILEEILNNFDVTVEQARACLGSIMFSGDVVNQKVGELSGGEKGRLSILKVLMAKPNFLIMDEPTNHLDIAGRQAAEELLAAYPGALLLVSHDRHFIDKVCEGLLVFENKALTRYWGNYTYYRERLNQLLEKAGLEEAAAGRVKKGKEIKPAEERQESPYTLRFKLKRLEEQIEQWEARKSILEINLSDSDYLADSGRARAGWEEYRDLEEMLERAYNEWEILADKLEIMGANP